MIQRCLAILVILAALFCTQAAAEETLQVTFYAIGKADAALITFADGSRVMIDAGTNDNGKKLAKRFIKEEIADIDTLIITHFDKDHVGGASRILRSCNVNRVIMPDYEENSESYLQFLDELDAWPQTEAVRLEAGEEMTLSFGEAVMRVSAAKKTYYGKNEVNDFSLAARIAYGETRFLFTGDAEAKRQKELLTEGDLACNVLKVPYHGGATYESADFLSACSPEIAWIPDGEEREADAALVQYLEEKLGADVYRGIDGEDLTVVSDGKTVKVQD